ncbi:MAG: hypothetical protein QOG68_281, partial [Solirubrobacteraceae bacterium]|nr:hypothetical protein [Solirubrobacteraceae bacterium]
MTAPLRSRPAAPTDVRQLIQDVSTGDLTVADVPAPAPAAGALLVATRCSLISAGTERATIDLGNRSLLGKARARPELARKVIDSVRDEGLRVAAQKVRGRLAEPNALGYSSCGVVLEAPADFPAGPGDLVACAGAGHAVHAEIVSVPRNLCARVPAGVEPAAAAYGTVATIALHGVRLAEVGLGDVVGVVGLGLVGQLTMDLVRAAGAVPLGLDPDPGRAQLARDGQAYATTDAAELAAEARRLTDGRGADAVLVTAASRDAGPLATAVDAARERAIVCIVGDVPIEHPRTPLFQKEVKLVVSRSYGPGRYDPSYEEHGIDYPAGYVRWTEGRNLEEVLRLMALGSLRTDRLTTHRVAFDQAPAAYELLDGAEPSLGILLEYPESPSRARSIAIPGARVSPRATTGRLRLGFLGAGSFARGTLMPAFADEADIAAVVNASGASAKATAERFGAAAAGTDPALILDDESIDAVVIASRHDTHARFAVAALQAGKHVFVEKPLALDEAELAEVESAAREADGVLMVGFNRRYAPMSLRIAEALGGAGPLLIQIRVSAGPIPRSHWVHDPAVGGGRLVGEGCHFVDLAAFLGGGPPVVTSATALSGSSEPVADNFTATLTFTNGSVAQIAYVAIGAKALSKERVEVLGERGAAVLDDFRELWLAKPAGRPATTRGRRDKGHVAEVKAFAEACRSGVAPQSLESAMASMRATFAVQDAL